MTLKHIELAISPVQPAALTVDDQVMDLSGVRRITVDHRAADVPVLYLEVPAEGTIVLDGVITERVVEKGTTNASLILKEFLSKLDPATLEGAILSEFDGMDGMSTGQAVINVFSRMADGHVTRT